MIYLFIATESYRRSVINAKKLTPQDYKIIKKYEDILGYKDAKLYYERDLLHKMKPRDYSMITTYARQHDIELVEL